MHEQGTDEWFAARLGKVTASRAADVMTKKGSAARANLSAQLVLERLTNTKGESFSSAAMQWGVDQEPFARAAYEAYSGVWVDTVGFVQHPTIERAGASPDGLVGHDGLVEIKCPNTATMIDTLLTGKVPGNYATQMQMQMACTGRDWCDYAVFDSRMPVKAQLFVKRVQRDQKFIDDLDKEIIAFLAEVEISYQFLINYIESK
jgi:putative phage-type endonuclease